MPTKKTPKTKEDKAYQISLALGDETFKGSGNTMLEALRSITPPVKVTTKGVIKATSGAKKMEATLVVPKVKRLFYPLAQTILAKQLDYLMR